jgi:hypothetical protein
MEEFAQRTFHFSLSIFHSWEHHVGCVHSTSRVRAIPRAVPILHQSCGSPLLPTQQVMSNAPSRELYLLRSTSSRNILFPRLVNSNGLLGLLFISAIITTTNGNSDSGVWMSSVATANSMVPRNQLPVVMEDRCMLLDRMTLLLVQCAASISPPFQRLKPYLSLDFFKVSYRVLL